MSEILFLMFLALVLVGPKHLPGLAAKVGGLYGKLQQAKGELFSQFETEVGEIKNVAGGINQPAVQPPGIAAPLQVEEKVSPTTIEARFAALSEPEAAVDASPSSRVSDQEAPRRVASAEALQVQCG